LFLVILLCFVIVNLILFQLTFIVFQVIQLRRIRQRNTIWAYFSHQVSRPVMWSLFRCSHWVVNSTPAESWQADAREAGMTNSLT